MRFAFTPRRGLRKAADAGDTDAQYSLGIVFDERAELET
jgi:hypothetical protein